VTDRAAWLELNNAFLFAALAWLRLRLTELASERVHVSPNGQQVKHSAEIDQAAALMRVAAQIDPPPALLTLSRQLGLSPFEQDIVLLCAAAELDTRLPAMCAQAQSDVTRPYPTFALALALFDDPRWDVLSPERPLRCWKLIEIGSIAAQPLIASPLRGDERIVNYVKGLNVLDDRLAPLLSELDDDSADLSPSQHRLADEILRQVQRAEAHQSTVIVQLLGSDSTSKQMMAQHVARALNVRVRRLPAPWLPTLPVELTAFTRLWQRESRLLPTALYLDAREIDRGSGSNIALAQFLTQASGVCFVDAPDALSTLEHVTLMFDIAKPTSDEQLTAWSALNLNGTAPRLTAQFDLNLAKIREIVQTALHPSTTRRAHAERNEMESKHARRSAQDAYGEAQIDTDAIWSACLAHTRPQLDALAQRITPKATWDDLVLPPDELSLLQHIAAQVRQRQQVYDAWGFARRMNRGLGITALFAGDSGTGKTMAAEVIANDLRLNLYRIDLSAVVNKYIGETEKNLRRVFDAAEAGGAILFFDEADALFGKRSEVKDSHDRYANIEINYLLQRMEAYRGLAILATNMKSALDPAFMRRLRFVVNFPFPGVSERKALWHKVFPIETPTGDLDYERLARLNLTGANIHSIALSAAFMAAQQQADVNMPTILRAARLEFRKLDRPVNEADFR
jgi:hypothetical protein